LSCFSEGEGRDGRKRKGDWKRKWRGEGKGGEEEREGSGPLSFQNVVAPLILRQVFRDCSVCLSSATDFIFGENLPCRNNKLSINTIIC